MKVKELKELLERIPEDREVILSNDEEGNRLQELCCIEEHYYYPGGYSGEIVTGEAVFEEEQPPFRVIVLYP
jgi:hypothetical protein